jgi:uncharacterized OB-fold protein
MAQPARPLPADFMQDERDREFWEAAARQELVLHQCQVCRQYYWPASCCTEHGIESMRWVPASGKGTVHTFTIYHRALNPIWKDDVPYNFSVIELAEGPLMFGNVVGCANEDLRCGMAVEVVFDEVAPGVRLPKFRPEGPNPAG